MKAGLGGGGGEGGMLQGFRAGAEAGDPVSLGVSSSWPWWSGEEKVRVVYLTTAMQLVKLGPGHTSRRPSLLPAPLSVPHSLGQGQVSPVGLEGEAGKQCEISPWVSQGKEWLEDASALGPVAPGVQWLWNCPGRSGFNGRWGEGAGRQAQTPLILLICFLLSFALSQVTA